MKKLKSEVVLYQRIIKNYKLSGIFAIDAFSFFGLDKLHVVIYVMQNVSGSSVVLIYSIERICGISISFLFFCFITITLYKRRT